MVDRVSEHGRAIRTVPRFFRSSTSSGHAVPAQSNVRSRWAPLDFAQKSSNGASHSGLSRVHGATVSYSRSDAGPIACQSVHPFGPQKTEMPFRRAVEQNFIGG